ncbi:MAG: hypothetical protein HY232_01535 [Acidobacteria bacterium]|nr:hypothetical protein [Acidobacteriota bacterium]
MKIWRDTSYEGMPEDGRRMKDERSRMASGKRAVAQRLGPFALILNIAFSSAISVGRTISPAPLIFGGLSIGRLCLIIGLLWGGLASCAKIADPRPVQVLIPRPATQLSGVQRGEQIELRCPPPDRNTNGTPVTTLRQIDIYRLVENRTYQPAGITSAEFARRAQKIQTISVEDLPRYRKGDTLIFTDTPAFTDRSTLYRTSLRYAVTFVNEKSKYAGFSNFFFISPMTIPLSPALNPPTGLEEAIELSWSYPEQNLDGSRPPKIIGFNIYRSLDPDPPAGPPLNGEPIRGVRYQDRSFEFGKTYYYSISVVANSDSPYVESLPSKPLAFTPKDIFPPKPPTDISVFGQVGEIRLAWAASAEADLAGYSIYRSQTSGTGYEKLNKNLLTATTFRDTNLPSGRPYFYVLTATDHSGNESRPSEEVHEIPE